MLCKRIIPCLDIKDGRVVKGVNFVGLRDAGEPVEVAKRYNDQGADELCFLDITASVEARGLLYDLIERVASQVFIPLTVGGGVKTAEDLRCDALNQIVEQTTRFNARRDVQKTQLIRALIVVSFRHFNRIARIAQTDEINAFDDATVFDVEARNDAFTEHI